MSTEESFKIGDSEVTLFGGIKGLISEGEELRKTLLSIRPEAILITISDEQIDGLSKFMKDPFEMIMSDYEIIYGAHLSIYGEVMTPPPIYTECVKYSEENEIRLIGLDLNEEDFSKLYQSKVGTMDLVRHSIRKRRLIKKEFGDKTPEEFVKLWEKRVNSIKSLRLIDDFRLESMQNSILALIQEYNWKRCLIVSDYEFFEKFKISLLSLKEGSL